MVGLSSKPTSVLEGGHENFKWEWISGVGSGEKTIKDLKALITKG